MRASAPLTFDQGQERVEAMMEQGTAFPHVDDVIDAGQLATEHKAALWLLAWSLRDRAHQCHDARVMLSAVGGATSGW